MASIGQFNEASCNQFNVLPLFMPILIVSCLILQLNLDPIIHMILRLHFIFVKSLVENLCSFGQCSFRLRVANWWNNLPSSYCLMSLGDLTFHSLYIIIYLMFDLFRVVFFCNLLFYNIACYICCCNRHIVVMCTYILL